MRIVLVDLEARDGLVTKDTVAGGHGSRFCPIGNGALARLVDQLDRKTFRVPAQREISLVSRAVTC